MKRTKEENWYLAEVRAEKGVTWQIKWGERVIGLDEINVRWE